MSNPLEEFVRRALAGGATPESIRSTLVSRGWESKEVDEALAHWDGVEFGVPVPRPRTHTSAAETFQILLMFTALYAFAFSFGVLLFEIVEHWLPTQGFRDFSRQTTRWALAWILPAFPLFLWMARRHHQVTRTDSARKHSPVRKWLTYLTLFVAATVLLGDAVALFYSLLDGELTARFVLKVLILGAIAGSIFTFYLLDLRQAERRSEGAERGLRLLAIALSVFVIASWIYGGMLVGGPATARAQRLDQQRLTDLRELASWIDHHHSENGALPPTLSVVESLPFQSPVALEDGAGYSYGYRVLDEDRYELCARFYEASEPPVRAVVDPWEHPAGEHCFQLEVNE